MKKQKLKEAISQNVTYDDKVICFQLNFSFFMQVLPTGLSAPNSGVDAIDEDMLQDLQQAKLLNWCRTADSVWPVKTKSDGNCLCHAVSTCIWGIDDDSVALRRLIALAIGATSNFQRWKNAYLNQSPVMDNTHDWNGEWQSVVALSSPNTDNSGAVPYAHLEAIHVFVLSQILRRPIIILGDSTARTIAGTSLQDNDICGIYLPLDWPPERCCKYPVILGYNLNHFCPLLPKVGDARNSVYCIPIISNDGSSLPVRFLFCQEERRAAELLKTYLQVKEVVLTRNDAISSVLCTEIKHTPMSKELDTLEAFIGDNRKQQTILVEASAGNFDTIACITPGCKFFGTQASGYLCSECLKQYLQTAEVCPSAEPSAPPPSFPLSIQNVDPLIVSGTRLSAEASAPTPSVPLSVQYVDLSIMQETCAAGCGYRCSTRTYPYCHECAAKHPGNGVVEAALFGPGQTHRSCQEAEVFAHNTRKHLCETLGCNGHPNGTRLCDTCSGKSTPSMNVSRMGFGEKQEGTDPGRIIPRLDETSELIVSGEHASSYGECSPKEECASPLCHQPVLHPNKLCQDCINILMRSQSNSKAGEEGHIQNILMTSQPNSKAGEEGHMQSPSKRELVARKSSEHLAVFQQKIKVSLAEISRHHSDPIGTRCKTPGCSFFGDQSSLGYCTKCYTDLLTAPANVQSSQCKTAGCQMFGDVTTSGYCTKCFYVASRQTDTHKPDAFKAMVHRVENEKRFQKFCKANSCANYGNARKEGFCNDCFVKYLKIV